MYKQVLVNAQNLNHILRVAEKWVRNDLLIEKFRTQVQSNNTYEDTIEVDTMLLLRILAKIAEATDSYAKLLSNLPTIVASAEYAAGNTDIDAPGYDAVVETTHALRVLLSRM